MDLLKSRAFGVTLHNLIEAQKKTFPLIQEEGLCLTD